jgi:hypothetical protein
MIHKKEKQMIYFNTAEKARGQIISGKATQMTATGFFKPNELESGGSLNQKDLMLLYDEITSYFWWDASVKVGKPWKTLAPAVGRIYSISYLLGKNFSFVSCSFTGRVASPLKTSEISTANKLTHIERPEYCLACLLTTLFTMKRSRKPLCLNWYSGSHRCFPLCLSTPLHQTVLNPLLCLGFTRPSCTCHSPSQYFWSGLSFLAQQRSDLHSL